MPDLAASWWTVVPPLAIALLAIAVPGGLVAWAMRLRGIAAAALAPVASVALWGAAGVLTQFTGPFTLPWTMLGLTIVVAVVGRLVVRRRDARPERARLSPTWLLAIAMAASAIAMAVLSYRGVASPALPNQTYDGIFHQNLALWIETTGHASAFESYHMTGVDGGSAFYPNAWHLLAAVAAGVTGATMPTAFAAVWIVLCGAIWLPGMVWATEVILRPRRRTLVLVTAALLASAFPAFPYLLLDWGTLYPTAIAMALMPAGLALLVLAVRAVRREPGSLRWPALVLAGGGWLLATVFAHPRTLFTFAVLAVPYLVWHWISAVRAGWRRGRRRAAGLGLAIPILVLLVVAVVATILVLRKYTGDGRPIGDHLNGGPATAHFDVWQGLWQLLAIAPPASPGDAVLLPSLLLGLATLAAAVLAATRLETRWLVVAWAAVAVLYLLAATTNADLAKVLTGLWYKDKYRILVATPIVAIPMLAAAAEWLADRLQRGRLRRRGANAVAVALAILVTLSAWLGPTLSGLATLTGEEYAVDGSDKGGRALDADDVAVLSQAARIIPDGERLLGDPWQGGIMAWVVAGIEPVFSSYTGSRDGGLTPDQAILAESLPTASPEVCAALERLRADYLFVDTEQTGGRAPGAYDYPGLAAATADDLGPVVASSGSARLIRITACG